MELSTATSSGAQALERAFFLLRLVARAAFEGAALTDLAAGSELPRPTARRLLKALVKEGMLGQDAQTRRYRIGPLAYELGLLASPPTHLLATCQPILRRIAAVTEDTVYLTLRSSIDGVCIGRIEASHAIRTLTIDVGGRRPLGVGATGLALLAALPEAEADLILRRNARDYRRYGGLSPQAVRENLEEARRSGFGYSVERITPGVSGIGVAIPNLRGAPFVGVSVASITARIIGPRQNFIQDLLKREAEALGGLLAADPVDDAPSYP
jgi:DNA-binding IclR family transcriptional regulator